MAPTTTKENPARDRCGPSPERPRARADLVDQPVERLEAEVVELAGRLAAGTYELLVLVRELDHRRSQHNHGNTDRRQPAR